MRLPVVSGVAPLSADWSASLELVLVLVLLEAVLPKHFECFK
jgi:hypothetical protein